MAASSLRSDPLFANPQKFAEAGEKIYTDRYKLEYEKEYKGQFVAIDVVTEEAYVSAAAEEALESGRRANPSGIFHLIRIGSPGAYKSSYSLNVESDRFV
jgi:hypothetical protein